MEKLELMHWILAYSGMMIHILMKLAEKQGQEGFTIKGFLKDNIFHGLATLIMIPVILIVITDTSLHELLPINYLTAMLAGYQTQSLFKSLVSVGRKRFKTEK